MKVIVGRDGEYQINPGNYFVNGKQKKGRYVISLKKDDVVDISENDNCRIEIARIA